MTSTDKVYTISAISDMLENEEKIYANALNQSDKIGVVELAKILEDFGSFKEAWELPLSELKHTVDNEEFNEFRSKINPQEDFENLKKKNIDIILYDELPYILKEIPLPPQILYIKGKMPDENVPHLAIVGTRKCTEYGKEASKKIINGLRGENLVIVSGLATGIDTCAHKGALENKLITIGVLGNGLSQNVFFPRQNLKLAEEIVENGGCVISEYAYSAHCNKFTFPQRNRIVAGLSRGTLVIEAPKKSGAMITAGMALEYNRDVLAVPGEIFKTNSKGTNKLLKEGAIPTTKADDILNALGLETKPKEKTIYELSEREKMIVSFLFEPIGRDELIRKINTPASIINSLLIQMEIKGIIKELDGKLYPEN